jgi:hypothetical protein
LNPREGGNQTDHRTIRTTYDPSNPPTLCVQNYRKEEEGRGVLVNNNRIGGKRLDFTSRTGENSVLEQPGISRATANDPFGQYSYPTRKPYLTEEGNEKQGLT